MVESFEGAESKYGKIYKVAGPLIVAENMSGAKMYETVKVGWDKLVGEIIKLEGDTASIQCYEDTCKYYPSLTNNSLFLSRPDRRRSRTQNPQTSFCRTRTR
jgi:vacuolar-type H+-ATPase subunit B/Vma2|tara:strand:- start:1957 stop:2262 length:306 start_codon:yes stop_codon:yes gene_type:complete